MDFFSEMSAIREVLEDGGVEVSIPTPEEVKVDYSAASDEELSRLKREFIDAHLEKIKLADGVLIANFKKRGVDGYIGANTLMEAAFAYALKKPIFVLHRLGEQPCRPEVLGMQPIFLEGDCRQLFAQLRRG